MGRLLDALRRKRSQPPSPKSGEACFDVTSPVEAEEIDKENAGGILDALRRKRSQPLSPNSGEACFDATSPVEVDESDRENAGGILDALRGKRHHLPSPRSVSPRLGSDISPRSAESALSISSPVDGIDKENEKPWRRGVDAKEDCVGLEQVHKSGPKLERGVKMDQWMEDSVEEIGVEVCEADSQLKEPPAITRPFLADPSIDEFADMSEVAPASSSESEHSSMAAAASVGEVTNFTEVSDDGILRDDEGNIIDRDEAEQNMLRDEDGNIIDPKTLVPSLSDCCESDDEFDDDNMLLDEEGNVIDPNTLVSTLSYRCESNDVGVDSGEKINLKELAAFEQGASVNSECNTMNERQGKIGNVIDPKTLVPTQSNTCESDNNDGDNSGEKIKLEESIITEKGRGKERNVIDPNTLVPTQSDTCESDNNDDDNSGEKIKLEESIITEKGQGKEGNVIDPKTLVPTQSNTCESDHNDDDNSGEKMQFEESTTIEKGTTAISEGDAPNEVQSDCGSKKIPLHTELHPSHGYNNVSQGDREKEHKMLLHHKANETHTNTKTKGRQNMYSSRWKRRNRRVSTGNQVFAHVIFHNQLSTLEEESSIDSHEIECSAEESESKSLPQNVSLNRNEKSCSSLSLDEKFICARWEYSMRVMDSLSGSGALIDARDEIDQMLGLGLAHANSLNSVPDDCSVESEAGEI